MHVNLIKKRPFYFIEFFHWASFKFASSQRMPVKWNFPSISFLLYNYGTLKKGSAQFEQG